VKKEGKRIINRRKYICRRIKKKFCKELSLPPPISAQSEVGITDLNCLMPNRILSCEKGGKNRIRSRQ
jgi:hypothetical protein